MDGGKGEICHLGVLRTAQGVERGALTHIGQTNDANAEGHWIPL
jgi:hypothetical protein